MEPDKNKDWLIRSRTRHRNVRLSLIVQRVTYCKLVVDFVDVFVDPAVMQ